MFDFKGIKFIQSKKKKKLVCKRDNISQFFWFQALAANFLVWHPVPLSDKIRFSGTVGLCDQCP